MKKQESTIDFINNTIDLLFQFIIWEKNLLRRIWRSKLFLHFSRIVERSKVKMLRLFEGKFWKIYLLRANIYNLIQQFRLALEYEFSIYSRHATTQSRVILNNNLALINQYQCTLHLHHQFQQ